MLDRIDIQIEVPALSFDELAEHRPSRDSQQMGAVVRAARKIQCGRNDAGRERHNAHLDRRQLRKFCPLDAASRALLRASINQRGLSARAYDKILRVARTIADVEGSRQICAEHVSEAIQYRILDRRRW